MNKDNLTLMLAEEKKNLIAEKRRKAKFEKRAEKVKAKQDEFAAKLEPMLREVLTIRRKKPLTFEDVRAYLEELGEKLSDLHLDGCDLEFEISDSNGEIGILEDNIAEIEEDIDSFEQ